MDASSPARTARHSSRTRAARASGRPERRTTASSNRPAPSRSPAAAAHRTRPSAARSRAAVCGVASPARRYAASASPTRPSASKQSPERYATAPSLPGGGGAVVRAASARANRPARKSVSATARSAWRGSRSSAGAVTAGRAGAKTFQVTTPVTPVPTSVRPANTTRPRRRRRGGAAAVEGAGVAGAAAGVMPAAAAACSAASCSATSRSASAIATSQAAAISAAVGSGTVGGGIGRLGGAGRDFPSHSRSTVPEIRPHPRFATRLRRHRWETTFRRARIPDLLRSTSQRRFQTGTNQPRGESRWAKPRTRPPTTQLDPAPPD